VTWTADRYRRFADVEAPGRSALYAAWADGVARDPEVLARLDALPRSTRLPHLLFAVARMHGSGHGGYAGFRGWLLEHWDAVAADLARRTVQTNEPRRAAVTAPVLAALPGPLAVVEVGASAGLCLIPDRYAYRYGDRVVGRSPLVLDCDVEGPVPVPADPPRISWRSGVDLHPLDVRDDGDTAWLEALIWPGQPDRVDRLRAAIALAREDPPRIEAGDAAEVLPALLEEAAAAVAPGGSVVVLTTGVLVYLADEHRARVADAIRSSGARWVALEEASVLDRVRRRLPDPTPDGVSYVLSLDEHPLAVADPHGRSLRWTAEPRALDALRAR
jgi:hypothetical protein